MSLQLFNKVDLQAVMKAGRWSSGGTFTFFYLMDLCPQADSLRKTGPGWQQEEWLLFHPVYVRLVVFYFFFMLLASSGEPC